MEFKKLLKQFDEDDIEMSLLEYDSSYKDNTKTRNIKSTKKQPVANKNESVFSALQSAFSLKDCFNDDLITTTTTSTIITVPRNINNRINDSMMKKDKDESTNKHDIHTEQKSNTKDKYYIVGRKEYLLKLLEINREYQKYIERNLIDLELEIERNKKMLKKAVNSYYSDNTITNTSSNRGRISMVDLILSEDKTPGEPWFQCDYINSQGNVETESPSNKDIEDLIAKKENLVPFFTVNYWKKSESESLVKGVNNLLAKEKLNNLQIVTSRSDYINGLNEIPTENNHITKDVTNLIHIVHRDILYKREKKEVINRWNNHDNPLINKEAFTKEEDKKLLDYVKTYGGYEWENIAFKLGTNRTPLACFQRYQRNLNSQLTKREWSKYEEQVLREGVTHSLQYGNKINWPYIAASFLPGRSSYQCYHKWNKSLIPNIKKGRWTKEEDESLIKAIQLYGLGNWSLIQNGVSSRTDVQCREHYYNHFDPNLDKSKWSSQEDQQLISLVGELGTKWSGISKKLTLKKRTDSQCRVHWKTLKKVKFEKTTLDEALKQEPQNQ